MLTKSRYLNGLQCPKYLWHKFHRKESIPEPDLVTRHKLRQGEQVFNLAKNLFEGGMDIPTEDFRKNIDIAKGLINDKKLFFEGGILIDNIYSRVDVLKPVENGEWDIIEVKSSTKVKEVHIDDVSFQKHCCKQAGIKLRNCSLAYVNNQYTKQGELDLNELFTIEDITPEVDEAIVGIEDRVSGMFEVISSEKEVESKIGTHCDKPYECPLKGQCWKFLPSGNVFILSRGGKKSWDLFERGIYDVKDIPDNFKLTDKQIIQKETERSGDTYTERETIKEFLNTLSYPIHYLDFETFNPAIPIFDGTKPYKRVPFQYFLYVVKEAGATPECFEFLSEDTEDPRHKLLFSLKKDIRDSGSIVVYNKTFEKGVLSELSEFCSEHKAWIDSTIERLIDLWDVFRNFSYYNPQQKGSASLKEVLPAVTGKDYSEMEINNGEDAAILFQEVTFNNVREEEKTKTREDLRKYCGLDTIGMHYIIEELKKV